MWRRLSGILAALAISAPALADHPHPIYRLKYFQVADSKPHDIPLNDEGATSITFATQPGTKTGLLITYNAECGAYGGGYLSISITVDGEPIKPRSGNDFAFCSAGAALVGATRNAFYFPHTSGAHTLRIVGIGMDGAVQWFISSSVLMIQPYLSY